MSGPIDPFEDFVGRMLGKTPEVVSIRTTAPCARCKRRTDYREGGPVPKVCFHCQLGFDEVERRCGRCSWSGWGHLLSSCPICGMPDEILLDSVCARLEQDPTNTYVSVVHAAHALMHTSESTLYSIDRLARLIDRRLAERKRQRDSK